MNIISFIRNLDRGKCVYFLRRLLATILPLRPYKACGRTTRCPCPAVQLQADMNGVAVGGDVCMKMNLK